MMAVFFVYTFGEVYDSALGAMSFTVIDTPKVVDPPVLVAVTVYVASAVTAFGVPVIAPVEVFNERPAGSEGATE